MTNILLTCLSTTTSSLFMYIFSCLSVFSTLFTGPTSTTISFKLLNKEGVYEN